MAKGTNNRANRLPPIPARLVYALIIAVVASWVPLALIAVNRVQTSERQRIHIFHDMGIQPRSQAQATSDVFADGRAMRPPVTGTIARGELREDDHLYRGYETDENFEPVMDGNEPAYLDDLPPEIELSYELLQRGRTHYEINCATCHGTAGYGDGLTHRRVTAINEAAIREGRDQPAPEWVRPFNLHERDAQGLIYGGERYPSGKLFHVIGEGIRTMPAYKEQMSVEDRWAVVAYVEALQLSQGMFLDEALEQMPELDPAALAGPLEPVPPVAEPDPEIAVDEVDLEDPELVAQGAQLWQTKICFTCHQTDPDQPPLNPNPGPSFVDGIFGLERNVHVGIGGPIETVVVDEEYFVESLVEPQALITEGYGPPAMMPPQPLTEEEILALMAYVKSLGTHWDNDEN